MKVVIASVVIGFAMLLSRGEGWVYFVGMFLVYMVSGGCATLICVFLGWGWGDTLVRG